MSTMWNPWHGCKKISEGCQNCYVYRRDESIGKDASQVVLTKSFDAPLKRLRDGSYKIPCGESVYSCMTSDFFIEEADVWREDAWNIMKVRSDLSFFIITKRIHRFLQCIPDDWNEGYENVTICCTIENQNQCNMRMPTFLKIPARKKQLICEPLLSAIDFGEFLNNNITKVTVGGESGQNGRICDYAWVLNIREQCIKSGVSFKFKQTGTNFLKDGKIYYIQRFKQYSQAKLAGIDISI